MIVIELENGLRELHQDDCRCKTCIDLLMEEKKMNEPWPPPAPPRPEPVIVEPEPEQQRFLAMSVDLEKPERSIFSRRWDFKATFLMYDIPDGEDRDKFYAELRRRTKHFKPNKARHTRIANAFYPQFQKYDEVVSRETLPKMTYADFIAGKPVPKQKRTSRKGE